MRREKKSEKEAEPKEEVWEDNLIRQLSVAPQWTEKKKDSIFSQPNCFSFLSGLLINPGKCVSVGRVV